MNIKQILLRLTENWPAKIICLVFAVFLSEFYRGTLLDKRYLIVPLTIENNGLLTPAEQYPAKIKVSIWGDAIGIGSIDENDIIAFINISDFKTEGTYRIPIKTRLAGTVTPLGNMEISTEPAILTLRLATSIRKQVPVTLSLKGIPADGYEVTESSLEPAAVEIECPAELVEKINELVTEPLSIEARTSGFSGTAAIINNNPLISIVGKAQVQHTVKNKRNNYPKKI
ncbi:YbbR-like domain-containing protein [Treponema vincentii]|uniref:CdaR family protein n=1 Tax=Treponema vincentii TaxID=69710 RepID=UPI001E6558F4|nr:YbbR-like domain-containing protein [Treponema vincentii]